MQLFRLIHRNDFPLLSNFELYVYFFFHIQKLMEGEQHVIISLQAIQFI
jgi:hypothetical protein